jgi:DNA-binding transcriptional LysR family regulator
MEIRQLRAFIAIVETGTFTAGAGRVHVTQAAISMQIRQLESEIGTPLFVRAPRRVLLTQAGEMLLERARRILREHDAALNELHELAGAECGRIRIGSASAMVSANPLPSILKDLRTRHPRAEVSLISGTSEELAEKLLAGVLDVAFVSLPVAAHGIEAEVLNEDEIVAIGPANHPLAARKTLALEELAGEKLILGEQGGNTRRLIDKAFEDNNLQPIISMELSRLDAIKGMVETGLGVGLVPLGAVREEVAKRRLTTWRVEGVKIKWGLGLAHLSSAPQASISQTFAKLCREYFGERAQSA